MRTESLLETRPGAFTFSSPSLLFNQNGHRIPPFGLTVYETDPKYRLDRLEVIDFESRLARLQNAGLALGIKASDFRQKTIDLFCQSLKNRRVNGIWNGPALPVWLPQVSIKDYGEAAEGFVTMAGQAYCRQFVSRPFINYRQGLMKDTVTIVPASRCQDLVAKITEASVFAVYFPCALQGFSVCAQREQMASLPEGFFLPEVITSGMALLTYPDILGRDSNVPFGLCSAVRWGEYGDEHQEHTLAFRIEDNRAIFTFTQSINLPSPGRPGGLLYIGG